MKCFGCLKTTGDGSHFCRACATHHEDLIRALGWNEKMLTKARDMRLFGALLCTFGVDPVQLLRDAYPAAFRKITADAIRSKVTEEAPHLANSSEKKIRKVHRDWVIAELPRGLVAPYKRKRARERLAKDGITVAVLQRKTENRNVSRKKRPKSGTQHVD